MSPKFMGHARVVVPLWAMYLGISAHFGLANLVVGLLLSVGISVLVHPPEWHVRTGSILRATTAAVAYVVTLVVEILRSGIQVSGLVLRRSMNLKSGIIAVKSGSDVPAIAAVSAHGITITPGEMVVAIGDDGTLYTHTLDTDASCAAAGRAQGLRDQRLNEALGVEPASSKGGGGEA